MILKLDLCKIEIYKLRFFVSLKKVSMLLLLLLLLLFFFFFFFFYLFGNYVPYDF